MFGSDDYINGYYEGQRNPRSNFLTLRNINQLKANIHMLAESNQSLQNDLNNLLNDRDKLKEGLLRAVEQRDALENLIRNQKETLDQIWLIILDLSIAEKNLTKEQFEKENQYIAELMNKVYELRTALLSKVSLTHS